MIDSSAARRDVNAADEAAHSFHGLEGQSVVRNFVS
jgi:hypothetical protein